MQPIHDKIIPDNYPLLTHQYLRNPVFKSPRLETIEEIALPYIMNKEIEDDYEKQKKEQEVKK